MIDPMAQLLSNRLKQAEKIIELAEKTFMDTACTEDVNVLLEAIKEYKTNG